MSKTEIGEEGMKLEECYDSFGGSYQDVKRRIQKDEAIQRFVIKFLKEESYEKLSKAMAAEDYEEAFKAAHTLKGISQNLSFKRLGDSACELTGFLRNKKPEEVDREQCEKLWQQVESDYGEVVSAIRSLQE